MDSPFIVALISIVCFLAGWWWGMRDKRKQEDTMIQRIAKERDYWHGIASRLKNEMFRYQTAGLIPKNELITPPDDKP